ncbi:MAG TPA: Ldh family oxidoreductase [Xanthobacteraceae bacterium]|nr:Ldh family oxidoreductase [Xanthobacteraceae bacterium]
MSEIRFPAEVLLAFAREALVSCGMPEGDAGTVAQAIIEADLVGADAHGIFRLPQYVRNLQSGRINPKARISILQRSPATALLDGDNGMGHLVMTHAAELAVKLAREAGVGWVGARRSNHAGAAGVYAAMMLGHGMVGLYAAVSSANHMAPWGGAEPLIGTNPIAVAIPAGAEAPVVLDIATSVASFGTIRTHALAGKPMPEGWVIDRKTGAPITDAQRVAEGVLRPIGGYKGSGLALMIGLLAGVLNGAAFGHEVIDFTVPGTEPCNTGQFVVALDVKRFMPPEVFVCEVDRHLRDLRASARLPGIDAIRYPGEQRLQRKMQRQREGVPLAAGLVKQLDELAGALKVQPLRVRA